MAEIESLTLRIAADSTNAVEGLTKLSTTLNTLKTATQGGLGLTSVANQVTKLSDALNKVNAGSGAANIRQLVDALKPLETLGKTNLGATLNPLKSLPKTLEGLTNMNMGDFGAKINEVMQALKPLETLGKSNLGSMVSQLKKLPETFAELSKIDMAKFEETIKRLATALKPLADELQKVSNGVSALPNKLMKVIDKAEKTSKSTKKMGGSFTDMYLKVRTATMTFRRIYSVLSKFLTLSNNFVEDMNLFNVSMGEYTKEAKAYAEQVGEIMSIDPGEWMRNQGTFMILATGFGVASDRAKVMSKSLTELGYDLASLYNMDVSETMLKLQSGLAGELEPLRRIGFDLSQARLQIEATNLGIKKKISEMTQAEKAEIRYHAILTQVTAAHGDMARTLDEPANQLRVLKAQLVQAGRAIGNVFLPGLKAILPYAIAIVKVFRLFADIIAKIAGYEPPEIKDLGLNGLASGADDASDAMDKASDSAKKLQKYTMGFDELNIIDPNQGAGSGADDALSGAGFNFDLETYDFLGKASQTKVDEIVNKLKEWLGITDEIDTWSEVLDTRLGHILQTVGLIGAGLIAWKVTKGFMDSIIVLKTLLANPVYAIAIGVALTLTGFAIELRGLKDAVKEGLDGFNFAEIVAGGILTTGGAALLGSKIVAWIGKVGSTKLVFALAEMGKNIGVATAGGLGAALGGAIAGIVAGIPAYFVGIYDACVNGIDWLSSLLVGAGATAAGAGIGAIIGMLGGPIGAGVGALIGLAVGLITDLVILIVQNWDSIVAWCGEACANIGKFFTDLWDGIVSVWNTVAEWFDTWVITPVVNFFTKMWDAVKDIALSCWDRIVEIFSPAIAWFTELFTSVWQTINDIFYNIWVIASGCWEIIKAVWAIVSAWFNEHIVTPVKEFFVGLWNTVSEYAINAWTTIKDTFNSVAKWFNDTVVTPVKNAFSTVWDKVKEGAKEAWDGIKEVFSTVATFFGDTFRTAWEGVKKVFEVGGKIFDGIKDGILNAFKTIVNALIKGINKVIKIPFDGINNALMKIKNIEILELKPFDSLKTINIPQIPLLASGGYPETGQMFVAREAGAELVGTIGRKTAVVNNEQIVASVSRGVAEANNESNALLREQNALLRGLLEKDSGVYLDGKKLTGSVEKYQKQRGRQIVVGGGI